MENQPDPITRNRRISCSPYCGCILIALAIPGLLVCLVFAWLKGVPDDISRWFRSFDYPAIEARFKPISDQLANVTSDVLVSESHQIWQATLMTNDNYTGVISGDFTSIYGTNRTLDVALNDYSRFFSSKPEWQVNTTYYWDARNSGHTAEVTIRTLNLIESPPGTWVKYRTVYEVKLYYGDPVLWGE